MVTKRKTKRRRSKGRRGRRKKKKRRRKKPKQKQKKMVAKAAMAIATTVAVGATNKTSDETQELCMDEGCKSHENNENVYIFQMLSNFDLCSSVLPLEILVLNDALTEIKLQLHCCVK
uniref:Uncharacterized protein n=1 Tax=Cucumis melo TaxID=3656 RepID=A0A9I9CX99_CUCME